MWEGLYYYVLLNFASIQKNLMLLINYLSFPALSDNVKIKNDSCCYFYKLLM